MRGLSACMRCGSLRLRSMKASEGGIGVAFFEQARCRDCGWQGTPLEFDDEAGRRAFAAAQAGWREPEGPEADAPGTPAPSASPVAACRQCGARDLRFEGAAAACPHCLWRGEPATFPDEAAWRAFAESRRNVGGRGGEAG